MFLFFWNVGREMTCILGRRSTKVDIIFSNDEERHVRNLSAHSN